MAELTFTEKMTHQEKTNATISWISIPEGTVVPIRINKGIGAGTLTSEGVTGLQEKVLNADDLQNYFIDANGRNQCKYHGDTAIPGTILDTLVSGTIVVTDQNLSAERINRIVELCLKLSTVYDYLEFAKDTINRVETASRGLDANPVILQNMKDANPRLFQVSMGDEIAKDFLGDSSFIIEQMGIMMDRMKLACQKAVDELKKITQELDDEKVASFGDHFHKPYWPVKSELFRLNNGYWDYQYLFKR